MEHHSCKCCCTHEHEQVKEAAGKCGFLKNYWRILLSAVLLFSGIILNATDAAFFRESHIPLLWYILAYLLVGLPVLKEAWESIREKDLFSEFTLMSIATLGAFYIGEYPEGVAVMLFYSLGELFQEKAVSKAKRNISALLDVRPETATLIRGKETIVENPRKVQVGETIEVKTGERVPLDGTMLTEAAAFNTSALTGESVPRNIRKGEEVLAGMIATDKVIRLEVTKPFEKSALSRILEMVQNASERKAPAELFIRKFARIYTPIVTGLAALIVLLPLVYSLINAEFTFIFDDWLYRALVFLVISCPCALVVSIPLGYFGGIGAASRLGVLFKGGNFLDAITKINTVVFDKTGTLTKGTFEVQSCRQVSDISEERLIQLIASVERNSTHPIAKAVVNYAVQRNIELISTTEVAEVAGHGLETFLDGERILVGNARLLSKFGVSYPQELQAIADTVKREYPEAEVLMGTATAGIAHAAIAAHLLGLPMGYVRSGNKDHGRQNRIEGRLDKGEKVVVVEDLISTGGSVLETVEALREAGAEVLGVVSIFTYGMKKGVERMAEASVKNVSLTNLDTIAQVGAEEGYIAPEDVARLLKFRDNPSDESWINGGEN
mgnify:CR=1 FL=1